ncbi:ABC transporter permease [Azospirillum sp. TSH100]|uniref:ABC transporter permease n=1 Tax=Azospirillum sp. TSH100 TaxID=652764 RepID=UPI000D60AC88|nr:ABC transporter permease [Azospirillum sp. TSH100]PWC91348.1 ABC transporter permease [Azospirillum sp. TSH100]QCG89231.1 ABC transporter permease [Azospirillum sp. TSH100]
MGRLTMTVSRRVIQALLVAVVVGVLCFLMSETLPGDQAFRVAAGRYGIDLVSVQAAETVRLDLGLDRPWWQRLAAWGGDLARGNLGLSLVSGEPVLDELAHQLGHSLLLAVLALGLSMLIGPPLGVLMAWRAGGAVDLAGLLLAAALRAAPSFALGILLMLCFSVWLPLLPTAGSGEPLGWILPAGALALGLAAMSSRVTRDAALAAMRAPPVFFGVTRGFSLWQAVQHHALRNALVPVVTYLGVQLVVLVEGVVVIESLFAWPGIGHALVHAVVARDIPMIQGTALVMGLLFVGLNMVVDALCLAIDPRGRAS